MDNRHKYFKGIGCNILISISFALLMTVFTFGFMAICTNQKFNDRTLLFLDNLTKLIASLVVYMVTTRLFVTDGFRIKAPTMNFKSIISFILGMVLLTLIFFENKIKVNNEEFIVISLSMLITGFSEELIYRVLSFKFYPNYGWITILLQAIVFSFIGHGIFDDFLNNLLYRLPLGILLGVIYKYTKSIWPVTWLHGLYDLSVYCNLI
jgi:membrane protease YdiL (CAAX protease family)